MDCYQQLYAWGHDSIPGKRLSSKKLGVVPAVIEDAGGTGLADGGGDEIVIRTAALASYVPPGASEEHIARVLAVVGQSDDHVIGIFLDQNIGDQRSYKRFPSRTQVGGPPG